MVRFESKWIGLLSLIVKLTLAISCSYLMSREHSYQIFDRSPISAVIMKVKQASSCSRNSSTINRVLRYNCTPSVFNVNDFILPPTENSALSITTRIIEIEHTLRSCNSVSKSINSLAHECSHSARCIIPPYYRPFFENNKTRDKHKLCWFPLPARQAQMNYQALDYIIFLKNFVEFPQFRVVQDNLNPPVLTKDYLNTCEYDEHHHPLCPKFRIIKILQMIEDDPYEYERMFIYGSLIEIKISWKCNLDRGLELCQPAYKFQRLDHKPYGDHPYEPGSRFLSARHFFVPNNRQLHRIHKHIYNLHIVVSVTGEAGRFDLFLTTTSIGSFLGIFGTGSIVCDLIATFLTNFKRVKYEV